MSSLKESAWIKTSCAYCGVGCGVEAKPSPNGILEIRGDKDHPANYGRLCSKGMALGDTVGHQGRLLKPSIAGQEVEWPEALNHVATEFSNVIAKYGPDSVAFYVSGQLLTEDYYLANKLMKGFIGSSNIDTNSRLCMSSTVVGHQRAFGTDTVPGCYSDLEQADMIVITGANMAWCHPVLYQRLKAVKQQRPEVFIVCIDPRQTATCEIADLYLGLKPGSDVALFNGLLAHLAETKTLDLEYIAQHTENFEAALASAVAGNKELTETLGISLDDLSLFYRRFAATPKVVTLFSQGVNQSSSGTDKVNSILNCHLATGRIGKPGSGPFSLTGQPNAMGGREVGGMATALAAHIGFNDKAGHQAISNFWQTDKLSKAPGLKAVDLFDAIDAGSIKAVWIMATNPVASLPNADKVKRALQKCPMVVVSDCIADTDTARCADVLLPAQGWSEKSGTVTNSERRISRQRRLLASPGEAKPDWWIIKEVAKCMGFAQAFDYSHEADVFREHAAMTGLNNADGRQRDLNLTGLSGISDRQYAELKPQQWPLLTLDSEITHKRLFADGRFFTASAKAQFIALKPQPPMNKVCEHYPLTLNTGRIRDQWHSMSRSGLSTRLSANSSEPYVSINASDADIYGVFDGGLAHVNSAWGQVLLRVSVNDSVLAGQIFIPIHWTDINASEARVGTLIGPERDVLSGQPEFKCTAAAIKPWSCNSEAIVLAEELLAEDLESKDFDYWVRQKVDGAYYYRFASHLTPDELSQRLRRIPSLAKQRFGTMTELAFSSAGKSQYRDASLIGGKLKSCRIVAASLQADDFQWLQDLYAKELDQTIASSILSGVAAPGLSTGKMVCACKGVSEEQIKQCLQTNKVDSLESLSKLSQAGTGCGSCLTEVQAIFEQAPEEADSLI